MSSPKVKKFNCAFRLLAQLQHNLFASQFSYQTPEISTLFLMFLTPNPSIAQMITLVLPAFKGDRCIHGAVVLQKIPETKDQS